MGQKRHIPFGYMIKDGKYTANEQEKEAVEYIFTEYVLGQSYNEIAKQMTDLGYGYREETDEWNKGMVKRVLENEKYIGNESFPQLIKPKLFIKANNFKNEKTSKYYRTDFSLTVRDKIFCKECGNRFFRNLNTRRYHKWNCSIQCFTPIKAIKEEYIEETVVKMFNMIKENPELIKEDKLEIRYEPSLEVTKKLNELDRLIESKSSTFEVMLRKIYECAEEKYKCCTMDQQNYLSDTIIAEFKLSEAMKEFDRCLFIKTVSGIYIDKRGDLEIEFINGASLKHNIYERND